MMTPERECTGLLPRLGRVQDGSRGDIVSGLRRPYLSHLVCYPNIHVAQRPRIHSRPLCGFELPNSSAASLI